MRNKWNKYIVGIIYFTSFILAIFLVSLVHISKNGKANLLQDSNAKILYDIPVINNLHSDKYIFENIPSVADVEINGTKFDIDRLGNESFFQLYIENQKLQLGKNSIEIKVKNNSNSLNVKVLNKFVTINVTEKTSKKVNIFPRIINQQVLSKLHVDKIVLSKKNIEFTGKIESIDLLQSAEAIIDARTLVKGKNVIQPLIQPLDEDGKTIGNLKVKTKMNIIVNIEEDK